jgi:HAD superfamily hydrolase (TIGR01509 family)
VRTVLLDLDRTLVDLQSFTDYDAAWADLRGLVDPALADVGPATGWSSSTRACMGVIAALPDGDEWRRASSAIERHETAAIGRSTAMPGVHQFLADLGDRPRAVITLLPETVARATLAHHGLDIEIVVGRDPRVRPKPAGDGLRRALEQLGSPASDAVMVGDSTWDALAALDAGVAFVGVHAPAGEFAALDPAVPAYPSLAEVARVL